MLWGIEFNPEIVEEVGDPLQATNLQCVKVEIKGENSITEIIAPDKDSLATAETKVEKKSSSSNVKIEENNVKEENEMNCGREKFEDFIIKEDFADQVGSGAYGLNQKILDKPRIPAQVGKKKPYECGECGKSFSQKGNLFNHILIHTGEKPHKCEECGKSFARKYTLSKHILIHTGEKLHDCERCGKSFSRNSDLTKHILIHTGERPYECKKCGKSFSRNSDLSKHNLIHTGERPHKCEKCGKSFYRKSYLSQHIFMHTGEKPNKCEACGKCFSLRGNLFRHIRTIHPQYVT